MKLQGAGPIWARYMGHSSWTSTIHTITAVVVSWSFLCCRVYSSQPTPCLSAEEGKSFALEYERGGRSHWELRLQTFASTEEVKTCPESETCDWGEFGQVSVTTRHIDNREVSHINISRVTPSWRNKTLRRVVEHETNTTRSAECKMDNYHKPESAHCEALKLGDNAIRFTCRTRRVYPELRCEVKQFGSKSVQNVLITDGFEYKNLLQSGGLYDSSCSVVIENLRPGQYQYFGALIPAVDYKGYVRSMSVAVMPTLPIEISAVKPYVSVLPHETVHVCMDTQKTITFLCHAHKFESCPDFEWLLWDPAKNTTSSLSLVTQGATATSLSDGTGCVSNYSTPVGRHHVGKHIVCSARSSNITAKHSVPVNVRLIPPVRAIFTEPNGRHLGKTLALSRGQRLTIGCSVDADDRLFTFHVYCDRNNEMFPPEHSFGYKLVFVITGWGFDSTSCRCIVEDVCYNVNTTLHITVVPSQNITNTNNALLPDDAGINVMLYVYIGAVVLIVLVCIISSLTMCLCRRGNPREYNRTCSDDHVYEHVVN